MILTFSVENWMSFRDRATFSMIASRERQHGERVSKVGKYQTKILPIAAIYGGNASGKTNFFKALSFARSLVVVGTQPDALIPVEPFRLDGKSTQQPSRFAFELLVDEIIYDFSFSVTRQKVFEEKLVEITSTREKVLYERFGDEIKLDKTLSKDSFLRFSFQGTRSNQLFLTNSVSQKVDHFRPIYQWFRDTIDLVAPDSRFEPFEQFLEESHPLYAAMNKMLSQLDTGITHLGGEEVSFENIPWPEPIKNHLRSILQAGMKEGTTFRLHGTETNDRYVVTRRGEELVAKKLFAFHPSSDGTKVRFEIHQESDGSQRIIDLLPAFLELSRPSSQKIYIIDEIDRSLHSLLIRKLLEMYLADCSADSRTQLLFTTHDLLLMDQSLLRRDEMWVAERDVLGNSRLVPLSDYSDIRYDKDIRKSYLQGRLGGIPQILLPSNVAPSALTQSKRK